MLCAVDMGGVRRLVGRGQDRQVWLASVVAVVSLLLAALEVGIYLSHSPPVDPVDRAKGTVELCQYVLQGSALVVAGLLLLARRAARVLGWILLGGALPFMMAACLSTWLRFATGVTSAITVAVYAQVALWNVPRVLFALIGLFFPTGRPPGRWARPLVAGLVAAILLNEAAGIVATRLWRPGAATMVNALYSPAWAAVALRFQPPLEAAIWLGVVVAALSPLARWRRGDRLMRRQIAIALPGFLLFLAEEFGRAQFVWNGWVAAARLALAVLWPAAIGYVIVRDRLYELDLVARRIVAGAVPLVLLAAVYVAAAVTMSAALPGAGARLAAAVAVLAALVGLVLRPAGGWVSARVDRLLYGDRAEPYQLVRRLASQLREGVGPAAMPVAVCQIVVSALRLPGAALETTVAGQARRLATVGELTAGRTPDSVDLWHHGQRVGRLLVAPRPGQSHLDELDRNALQPLADLAAPAVSALALRTELAASRALLDDAQEQERRRLLRDVHDGFGPALAAVRLRVEAAAALSPPGSASGSLLDEASRQLQEIVEEVRRITDNLQPPALEQLGLCAALAQLAQRLSGPALPIEVELAEHLPALAPETELAAYRIVAEALTNTIRHAAATRALIRLTGSDDAITITVADDGIGLPSGTVRRGVGLSSMAERATDLGGVCEVSSGGAGTTVTARLPARPPGLATLLAG
jgi:signal transduction histidine kinase